MGAKSLFFGVGTGMLHGLSFPILTRTFFLLKQKGKDTWQNLK